jgi:O-methyltransferase
MKKTLKNFASNLLQRFGLKLIRVKKNGLPIDFDEEIHDVISSFHEYTMTSPEKIKVLVDAVNYISMHQVPGAFVECGVWRGGSSMIAANAFKKLKDAREFYLFDAFDLPIPVPVSEDKDVFGARILGGAAEGQPYWNAITESEVGANMRSIGYPEDSIHLIKGLVGDTVPDRAPSTIAILRLDTDTYESTAHNLKHLYPRISRGGILLLDDYGTHLGVRKAVDDYVASNPDQKIFLIRIDSAGAIAVKP